MKGSGLLIQYDEKVIVEVDPELGRFYRSLIPKAKGVHGTRYPPHITVVRKEEFVKSSSSFEVQFEYSTDIKNDHVYWWLPVQCRELNEFRVSLGLSKWSELCRPPDGTDNFHITIGNTK